MAATTNTPTICILDPLFNAFGQHRTEYPVLLDRLTSTLTNLLSLSECAYNSNGLYLVDLTLKMLTGDQYADVVRCKCNTSNEQAWNIPEASSQALDKAAFDHSQLTKYTDEAKKLSWAQLYDRVFHATKILLHNLPIDQENKKHHRWVIDQVVYTLAGSYLYQQLVNLYDTNLGDDHWDQGQASKDAVCLSCS
jgi:hypothetical protein